MTVVMLASEARKPKHWRWLWTLTGAQPPSEAGQEQEGQEGVAAGSMESEAGSATAGLGRGDELADDETDLRRQAALREALGAIDWSAVHDNTVFLAEEHDAWFGALEALRRSSPAAIRRLAREGLGAIHLMQQTDAYRGAVVTIVGRLRRANYVPAAPNDHEIDGYWQLWCQPPGGADFPIVIYSLKYPEAAPRGREIDLPVQVSGVLFKKWAYVAADGERVAPLILAASVELTRADVSSPVSSASDVEGSIPMAANDPVDGTGVSIPGLLADYGYSPDDWQAFVDGDPLPEGEQTTWLRLMQRLGRLEERDFELAAGSTPPSDWGSGAAPTRGSVYRLSGRLREIVRHGATEAEADRYGLPELYELGVEVGDGGPRWTVIASSVPGAWLQHDAGPIDEPVRCLGVLVKLDTTSSQTAQPVWATTRVEWYPEEPNPALGVEPDLVVLSRLGVDIGRLQSVPAQGPLGFEDRTAFYQLLAALHRAEDSDWTRQARHQWDIASWLKQPRGQQGLLYRVAGTARRAVPIEIVDPEVRSRFGLDRYYEVEVFAELDRPLKLVDPDGLPADVDDTSQIFTTYPIVFCCSRLPRGMPIGEEIHAAVAITGSYFKLWTYRAGPQSQPDVHPPDVRPPDVHPPIARRAVRQASPLFLGATLELVAVPRETGRSLQLVVVSILGATFFLLCIAGWIWRRSDRRARMRIERAR
jgi:hypothetical protein